jgi:SAM-dependent methyltransferase
MNLKTLRKHQRLIDTNALKDDWTKRPIIQYEKYLIPSYKDENGKFSNELIDTSASKKIIENKNHYKDKVFLDIGTGTGINNIILTDNGFKVIGVDRRRDFLTGSIYTMMLNNIFYDVILGDHKCVNFIEYDVLLLIGVFNSKSLIDTFVPLINKERLKGKEVIFYSKNNFDKIINHEDYIEDARNRIV